MNKISRSILTLTIGALAALGVACDDEQSASNAALRIIHLSPTAPPVDVHVDEESTPTFMDIAFEEGSGYEYVVPGSTILDITPMGAGLDGSVLTVEGVALDAGRDYTAVAWDDVSNLGALAFEDSTSGLAAGDIRVRIIHAANAFGEVDVLNVGNAALPTPIVEDLATGEVAETVDIPAGAYAVGLDVDDDGFAEVEFELPALPAGTLVNVFAVNDDDDDIFLLAQLPDSSIARIDPRGSRTFVRVLHLSNDAPPVDVYANDGATPALKDLPFGGGTPYVALPDDDYFFDIAPQNTSIGASVFTTGTLSLSEDTFYSAVAIGRVGDMGDTAFSVLPLVDDVDETAAGQIRIRIIHAATAVGQVDIYEVSNPGSPALLFENASFGDAQGSPLELPAAAYTVGIDTNDDPGTMELVFALPALAAGTIANAFAVNDSAAEGGAIYLVVHLLDGSTVQIDPL